MWTVTFVNICDISSLFVFILGIMAKSLLSASWYMKQSSSRILNKAKQAVPFSAISLMAPKPKLFYSDMIKAKLVIFTHIGHASCLSSMRCRVCVKLISG